MIIIPIFILYHYGIFNYKQIYNLNSSQMSKGLQSTKSHFKTEITFNSTKKNKANIWFPGNITEILDNYFNLTPNYNKGAKKYFFEVFHNIASLKVYSKEDEDSKKLLKEKFSEKFKKNISLVQNIFITRGGYFGNQICCLNNIIFYSEILGIKNIYLNSNINYLYIKNKVATDKINIELKQSNQINCQSENTICGHIFFDLKRNLPKVNIDENDLYIHIRTGDVFEKNGNLYSPPPYCFYQKILNNFKFRKIYLMSMDDKSPIIGKLMSDYPNIIHEFHSVEEDIATLMNAYNIVNSVSSFSQVSIYFNDNINNLWEYDFYKIDQKIFHFHHDYEKLNRVFNIYKMKPSENYVKEMFNWRNEDYQKKLMLNETCKYDFIKTNSIETLF